MYVYMQRTSTLGAPTPEAMIWTIGPGYLHNLYKPLSELLGEQGFISRDPQELPALRKEFPDSTELATAVFAR